MDRIGRKTQKWTYAFNKPQDPIYIYIYTVETRTFAFTYLQEQDSNLYPKLEKFSPDARNYNIQSVF